MSGPLIKTIVAFMGDDDLLWVRCVEALFARGKTFAEALEAADTIIAARLRRAPPARPGLAKCGPGRVLLLSASPPAAAGERLLQ